MIRVIEKPKQEDEMRIKCPNCKCVLGFTVFDTDDEYEGYYIHCPECGHLIDVSEIIRENI